MVKNNIVDNNILSIIKIPKVSKKLPHLLSKDEINNLFSIDLTDNQILMEMCILMI